MDSLTESMTDSLYFNYSRRYDLDYLESEWLLINTKEEKINLLKMKETSLSKAPPDKFYISALVAFFSGMCAILPMIFFLIANDYWMYKFRDPTQASYDLNKKTYLQTTFVSMISLCTAFPHVISVFLTARFGYKIKIKIRFLLALGQYCLMFILFTFFVLINTDSWQTVFFWMTLTLFAISAYFHPFYAMTNLAYLARFPPFYMKLHMMGLAISGLFSTCLQIISLTVGQTSTQIAMIYFSSGTVILLFTFFLMYTMEYSPTIQFYLEDGNELREYHHYSLREYWEAAKQIWFILVINIIIGSTSNFGHPNITNLIVSEGYKGTGTSLWHDKYFVVVATYLLYDVFQIFGRFFGRPLITKKTAVYFISLTMLRSLVLTPMFWFCNVQPRKNLPIWFPYDYQYMIVLSLHSFTGSVIMVMSFLSIPRIAKEKAELAFILMMGTSTISATITSPLSPIYVNLL